MRALVEVIVWRGAIPESRHRVQVAVSDPHGGLAFETETPHLVTTLRSAAKPFQLLPLVERGHADRWRWTDEQLAVMASSHTGSSYHVALVAGILERLGLEDRHLACGFHEPLDPQARARLDAHPGERSPLYNNCSGKHAGMLCLAISEGWAVEGYEQAGHPVQRLMHRTVAEICALAPEAVPVAIDGCNVSVFGLPLSRIARAYARLATARPDGDARERAMDRIRTAMRSFPQAAGGAGRLSTDLMEAKGEARVAKGGAEGLECAGLPSRHLGIAVKCEDGQALAVGPALLEVLDHLGALSGDESEGLAGWRRPVLRNHSGLVVGHLEATVRSSAPATP